MTQAVAKLACLALLLVTTGFSVLAGNGILHGFVADSSGAPVTGLTAVITQIEGQFVFEESVLLTGTGEFIVNAPPGSYLIELIDESQDVVGYRTGINVFDDITTFQFMTVDLPTTCQANLGFGSAGGMTLSLCGDDLTTAESVANLSVYNATPSSVVFMPIGLTAAPTPFKGGTLVPLPWLALIALPASNTGTIDFPLPGAAGTPITLYLQVVDPNGSSYRFSNAIAAAIGV